MPFQNPTPKLGNKSLHVLSVSIGKQNENTKNRRSRNKISRAYFLKGFFVSIGYA